MNKRPNQRILGMTQSELLILFIMGSLLFCTLIIFAGYIIYTNRSLTVAVIPSTSIPSQPTQPLPSAGPIIPTLGTTIQLPTVPPTIALPTNTPLPSETPILPTLTQQPIGILRVNHWLFEITAVHSDPGINSSRQQIVLLGNITNEGTSTDTFVAYAKLVLKDSQGRKYEDDQTGTYSAWRKYGTEIAASMNPGARVYVAIAFDVPSSERTFTIIPGGLVVSWSGNITFTLP